MKKESGKLIFAAVWICVIAHASNARSEQLPNETDLKAAYCIGALQNSIAGLNAMPTSQSATDDVKKYFAQAREKLDTDLRRLQLYLLPRLTYLDAAGIALARIRGDEDAIRSISDMAGCLPGCAKDGAECSSKCST